MTTYLLDANVLIALVVHDHVEHEKVVRWATSVDRFATCPVVEGALVRFAVRLGARLAVVQQTLRALHHRTEFEFWPDSASYVDVNLLHVRGHCQVTDAYLAGLAGSHPGGKLATLDEGLAQDFPEVILLVSA